MNKRYIKSLIAVLTLSTLTLTGCKKVGDQESTTPNNKVERNNDISLPVIPLALRAAGTGEGATYTTEDGQNEDTINKDAQGNDKVNSIKVVSDNATSLSEMLASTNRPSPNSAYIDITNSGTWVQGTSNKIHFKLFSGNHPAVFLGNITEGTDYTTDNIDTKTIATSDTYLVQDNQPMSSVKYDLTAVPLTGTPKGKLQNGGQDLAYIKLTRMTARVDLQVKSTEVIADGQTKIDEDAQGIKVYKIVFMNVPKKMYIMKDQFPTATTPESEYKAFYFGEDEIPSKLSLADETTIGNTSDANTGAWHTAVQTFILPENIVSKLTDTSKQELYTTKVKIYLSKEYPFQFDPKQTGDDTNLGTGGEDKDSPKTDETIPSFFDEGRQTVTIRKSIVVDITDAKDIIRNHLYKLTVVINGFKPNDPVDYKVKYNILPYEDKTVNYPDYQ